MCLILFAYQCHSDYRLVLAANRDEYYARPTQPAHWWAEFPGVLAGRDLQQGGSWLGLDRRGRLAAVTNVRNPADLLPQSRSRGLLVRDWLGGSESARLAAERLVQASDYAGFNLLLMDRQEFWATSNRSPAVLLSPGLHGLSNARIDTPWPKVVRGKRQLEALLNAGTLTADALFALLGDEERAGDGELPQTGVGLEWERRLSSIFIRSATYGTRAATVVLQRHDGRTLFAERSFGPDGKVESEMRVEFALSPT